MSITEHQLSYTGQNRLSKEHSSDIKQTSRIEMLGAYQDLYCLHQDL